MGNLKKGTSSLQSALAILALSFGAVACGDDDSSNKDGGLIIQLPDSGTKPLDSGVGAIDSGFVGKSDGGGDSGPIVTQPVSCVVKPDCTCTPTTSLEFLNSCTTATCFPFDNTTRIPGFTGTLPPLQ